LFNEAERAFNLRVKSMLDELGVETWFPQEDAGFLEQYMEQGMTLAQARHHIYSQNLKAVEAADVLIFCLDGRVPDEGACIEAGVAFGRGKRVIGLQTDFRAVEPGGNNLMIDGIIDYQIAHTIDELRRMLQDFPTGTTGDATIDLAGDEPTIDLRSSTHPYVAVSGPLGVGKTSLVSLMKRHADWTVLEEPIDENPYLGEVYSNLEDLGFRMQSYYLGQRARQHLAMRDLSGAVVQERCLAEDAEVFFPAYRDRGAYDDNDLRTLYTLYEVLADTVPTPDLIVYLSAPFETTVDRIRHRDRNGERQLDLQFLRAIYDRYGEWESNHLDSPMVRIDTAHLDYVRDPDAASNVLRRVDEALAGSALTV
jgi:deoxyguanosine kinase